ncbi:MAG: glycosyltransferase family 39 protein [Candidatus Bathyarchaeia archaeon]
MKSKQFSILKFVLILGLVIGTIFSRVPFQAKDFTSFDAINYTMALSHFDMRLHQPHPPGYILYILLGRAFNLAFQDPRLALLWLSTITSGLAVLAVYLLGMEMFGRRAGVLAACFLAVLPFFWYYGEISAPYTIDLFFAALLGWLCYRALKLDGEKHVYICALALGLAGAFRPQTMIFFFPLFLYSVRHRQFKIIFSSSVLVLITFGLFFIPSVLASGGFKSFIRLMFDILPLFSSTNNLVRYTRLERFQYNAYYILRHTFVAVGELIWPFIALGVLALWKTDKSSRKERIIFLGLMVLPIWVIYFLIWAGNPGTFLVTLPPFILLTAFGLDWLIDLPHWKTVGWIGLVLLIIAQIAIFTLLPAEPLGEAYHGLYNNQAVVRQVDYYKDKLAFIREFPIEGTIVYAREFRHLQYYLPEYSVFTEPKLDPIDPNLVRYVLFVKNGETHWWTNVDVSTLIPPGIKTIILFDLLLEETLVDQSIAEEKSLKGFSIYVIQAPQNQSFVWTSNGISLLP